MKNETFTPERIKAEADAFFEWDGEDRSLVTTTSCLLFAQHIAGLMQARAAQPAPVVPYVSAMARVLSDRSADACNINRDDNWAMYGNEFIEDVEAMLSAAAPSQGQQVECQECERLRMQLTACGVVALSNTPESAAKARDMHSDYMSASCQDVMRAVDSEMALRAELSALKAQQVGQEPAAPECVERIRTLLPRFEAGVNWTGEDAAELAEAAYDAAELLTSGRGGPAAGRGRAGGGSACGSRRP